jgi:hypothetical protein
VVTVTSTVPDPGTGLTAVRVVDDTNVTAALMPPNITVAPLVKPFPMIVTDVVLACFPAVGLTLVTVGSAS